MPRLSGEDLGEELGRGAFRNAAEYIAAGGTQRSWDSYQRDTALNRGVGGTFWTDPVEGSKPLQTPYGQVFVPKGSNVRWNPPAGPAPTAAAPVVAGAAIRRGQMPIQSATATDQRGRIVRPGDFPLIAQSPQVPRPLAMSGRYGPQGGYNPPQGGYTGQGVPQQLGGYGGGDAGGYRSQGAYGAFEPAPMAPQAPTQRPLSVTHATLLARAGNPELARRVQQRIVGGFGPDPNLEAEVAAALGPRTNQASAVAPQSMSADEFMQARARGNVYGPQGDYQSQGGYTGQGGVSQMGRGAYPQGAYRPQGVGYGPQRGYGGGGGYTGQGVPQLGRGGYGPQGEGSYGRAPVAPDAGDAYGGMIPGLQSVFRGRQQRSPQTPLPWLSGQANTNLLPSERRILGAEALSRGIDPEDYFDQSRRLTQMAAPPRGYTRARRPF